jgi:hypothetical protein
MPLQTPVAASPLKSPHPSNSLPDAPSPSQRESRESDMLHPEITTPPPSGALHRSQLRCLGTRRLRLGNLPPSLQRNRERGNELTKETKASPPQNRNDKKKSGPTENKPADGINKKTKWTRQSRNLHAAKCGDSGDFKTNGQGSDLWPIDISASWKLGK